MPACVRHRTLERDVRTQLPAASVDAVVVDDVAAASAAAAGAIFESFVIRLGALTNSLTISVSWTNEHPFFARINELYKKG